MGTFETYELYHYGVKGMRWGIRKNPSKAFIKASKKANRLTKRADKAHKKSIKAIEKRTRAEKRWSGWGLQSNRGLLNATKQAARWSRKTYKRTNKANKWLKKMRKAFSQVKVTDISDAALAKGRNYINMLDRSDLDRR